MNSNPPKSKDEIIAAIKECAAELGRAPSAAELYKAKDITAGMFRRRFGTYRKALAACGMEPWRGVLLSLEELFADWAAVVRRMGRLPKKAEYELEGKHSAGPLSRHFGSWRNVGLGMLKYLEENKLEENWHDIVEMIRRDCQIVRGTLGTSAIATGIATKPKIYPDRPLYGRPLLSPGLAHFPTNEAGVLFFFGMVAIRLGFLVTHVGTVFPDVEALREVEPGRWQTVRIELEFESSNFLSHSHDLAGCDMIVCWEHNWPECPLEVIELKGLAERMSAPNPLIG